MSPKDHGFDWVTVRAECSLAVQFERIKAAVKEDIVARNKLVSNGGSLHFNFSEREKDRMFYVTAHYNPKNSSSVYFMLNPSHILVQDNVENEIFRASLTLNADGDCRYKMAKGEDGTYDGEYLRWQVIRKALETLFF